MDTGSTIYQRDGYPLGELVKLATLRARDSRQAVRVVLEDNSYVDVEVPWGMP